MIGIFCKYLLLIFFYSSNNNQINIKQQLMDFFIIYFINTDNPDKDIIIRFYLSIFKLYIEFYKTFDISLFEFWRDKIKPFIDEKYPESNTGIFTANSDIHYIKKIIDNLNVEYKPNDINKVEEKEKEKVEENQKTENLIITPTPTSTSKPPPTSSMTVISDNKKIDNDNKIVNEEKNVKNKLLFKRTTLKEEDEIKRLRNQNLIRINNFLKDFIKDNKLNQKRSNSMMSLRHCKTISSTTTCADSICLEDIKTNNMPINLNKFRVDDNENIINNNINNQKIETKESKKKFGNFIGIQKCQTTNFIIKMFPQYKEIEADNEKNYIEYNDKKELLNISADLLLKKIIFENFITNNLLLIYHFCQQCFCFIDEKIFFQKLFHCYKIYKTKNISLDKLKNLFEFINILIIENFFYHFNNENHNEKQMALIKMIKKNYNELINDLLTNFKEIDKIEKINNIKVEENNNKEDNKIKKNFRFDSYELDKENYLPEDIIFDRNNLLNLNLNIHKKKINIFFYKEKKEEKEEKENIVTEEKNKNQKNDKNTEDNIENASDINIKFPSFYRISKTLKIPNNTNKNNIFDLIQKSYTDKVGEEIKEENNEEDSNSSSSSNSIKEKNPLNDIYEEIQSEDDDLVMLEEGPDDIKASEQINNILNKVFSGEKILSTKNELLIQLYNILPLLSIENSDDISIQDIQKAKSTIQFYSDIRIKSKIILQDLSIKRVKLEKNRTYSVFKNFSNNKINNKNIISNKNYFCIIDYNVEDIGEKLAQISKSNLDKIYPRELYKGIYLKKDKIIRSPNVVNCIQNFNKLTSFIIEDIISYDSPKQRAKVYEKWVLICDYCRLNKNYNDTIAIFSALNNYIITGLKLTLKEVKYKTKCIFDNISNFCSVEGNYRNIRNDIDLCIKNEDNFIPYLGLLLRDINFIEESSKYLNEKGCINMEKIEKINDLLDKYFKYKKDDNKNNEKIIPRNLDFFENLENISEEELEKIANNIEPEFKFEKIETKRLTNIDKKYFRKKLEKRGTFSGNMRLSFGGGSKLLNSFKNDK